MRRCLPHKEHICRTTHKIPVPKYSSLASICLTQMPFPCINTVSCAIALLAAWKVQTLTFMQTPKLTATSYRHVRSVSPRFAPFTLSMQPVAYNGPTAADVARCVRDFVRSRTCKHSYAGLVATLVGKNVFLSCWAFF